MADKKTEKKEPVAGAAKQQPKPAGNARPTPKAGDKPREKAIPVDKLNASNDE